VIRRFSVIFNFWAAIMVLIAAPVFGQVPHPPPGFQFSSDGASLRIPVEVVADGLVFVHAKVNGSLGWFIVDNGTQGFIVDRDYARKNSLQSSGSAVTSGVGSDASQAGIVQDVDIALPGLELTHRNLLVTELKSLEPVVGHEVDGIIGSRLFDDFVVVLDYEHQLLSVYAPKEYRPSGKETVFAVRIDQHGFQYVDATISLAGAAPVRGSFLIDGGANYYANIYKPFSEAHQIPPSSMRLLSEPGTGQPREGLADRMEIGPYSIKNFPITFAQDGEGLMASKDYAGLVGAEFLKRFTVVFNNPGKQILLTPNQSYRDAAEYDESGLKIRAEAPNFHRFIVTRIVPQSPAVEAGIEPDDVIESIDHRSSQEMTLTEVRSMLRRPNARCTIGVLRGSSHLQVVLQLRPLL
jgi:PDZ domain-containing protein/aspartyl protease